MGLPCWPIGFITFSLGLPWLLCWPIVFIIYFLGLLRPIYSTITSCCAQRLVSCNSCNTGPLDLLHLFSIFDGPFILLLALSFLFFSHLPQLLDFFHHWAFCKKWASTKGRVLIFSNLKRIKCNFLLCLGWSIIPPNFKSGECYYLFIY